MLKLCISLNKSTCRLPATASGTVTCEFSGILAPGPSPKERGGGTMRQGKSGWLREKFFGGQLHWLGEEALCELMLLRVQVQAYTLPVCTNCTNSCKYCSVNRCCEYFSRCSCGLRGPASQSMLSQWRVSKMSSK